MTPVTAPPRTVRRPTGPASTLSRGSGLPRDTVSGMPIHRDGLHPATVWFLSVLGATIGTALIMLAILAVFPRS